jgi:molybdopterin molybdotransferase
VLTVEQAQQRLLAAPRPALPVEEVTLVQALGGVLAQPCHAVLDVPQYANSAMDGYAFRHADCTKDGRLLPISQRIAAGHSPVELHPGTAARIFTGAEIPPGADTVAMQEDCEIIDGMLRIRELPARGENVRPRAQDIAAGSLLLDQGQRLRPQDLGLLASQGFSSIGVYRRLSVALISTGDELVEPGQPLGRGQIYNSNRYTVMGVLQSWGFEVIDFGIARDQPAALARTLEQATQRADVVLTTGGVSVGEEDHVKAVVESMGSLDLWRIAVKPGKPFAFGQVMGKPFLGLPGNPVSVFVTLLVIARPFLLACQGMPGGSPVAFRKVKALFDRPGGGREDYLRVRLTGDGAELFASQSSGVLLSASHSDGLVRQRIGADIHRGDAVDFVPYALLL